MTCQTCIMAEGREREYGIWCILRKMHYEPDHSCHAWCSSGLSWLRAMELYDALIGTLVATMPVRGARFQTENELILLMEARKRARKKVEKECTDERR